MPSPGHLVTEPRCTDCAMRNEQPFRRMSPDSASALEKLKVTSVYPRGSALFVEGEKPIGVFILRNTRAEVTTTSSEGKIVIVSIAQPGEVLGASASFLGLPYAVSARTIETGQVSFVRRDDFLRFIDSHDDAAMHAAICCEVGATARMLIGAKQTQTPHPSK